MFCTNCGTKLPDGAAFCTGCGKKIGGAAGAQPQNNYSVPQGGYITPNAYASGYNQQNNYSTQGGFGQQNNGYSNQGAGANQPFAQPQTDLNYEMPKGAIKVFHIPPEVRKQYAKFLTLEIYPNKVVGKGSREGDVTWFFKDYITVKFQVASVACQFAQLVFINHENANKVIQASGLDAAVDVNRILFCSGMFSYEPANNYVRMIHAEIIKVINEYKEKQESGEPMMRSAAPTPADEIKKYKELLDIGAISQEEFDAKKKQLLGL